MGKPKLTKREMQLLVRYDAKMRGQEIADELKLSKRTIDCHNMMLRAKLNNSKSIKLALIYAREIGII